MDIETAKRFYEACRLARRITERLPELPEGITPRDVHIVEAIHQVSCERGQVCISDVSERMGVTRPGITGAITRLEASGIVWKRPHASDGRAVLVGLTPEGERLYHLYVELYFAWVAERLEEVSDGDVACVARTIEKAYAVMASDIPDLEKLALDEAAVEGICDDE